MLLQRIDWIQRERAPHMAFAFLWMFLFGAVAVYYFEAAHLLTLAIPGAALLVAGWLYISHPALYLWFVWWTWLTTPFLRRVVEYQTGFDGMNLVMTAPLAATAFTLVTLVRFSGALRNREYTPYGLAFLAVAYGFIVGVVKTSVMGAVLGTLSWLLPIALGLHLHLVWREYPSHRESMLRVFRWGILILGIYGVLQFVAPAPWDRVWMINSGMNSIGSPEPYLIRVFGMLNAPGPFASIMLAGLILLFSDRTVIGRLALGPGLVAFLLTLVRAAWGGWVVAVAFMGWRAHGTDRKRILSVLLIGIVLMVPLMLTGPIYERVASRAETLSGIQEDNSFNDRSEFLSISTGWVLTNPIGSGIGSTGRSAQMSDEGGLGTFDNGIFAIPYSVGWLGGLLYYTSVFLMLRRIMALQSEDTDMFVIAAGAVCVSLFAQLIFSNSFVGIKGLLFWTFFGLSMAGVRYHRPVLTT